MEMVPVLALVRWAMTLISEQPEVLVVVVALMDMLLPLLHSPLAVVLEVVLMDFLALDYLEVLLRRPVIMVVQDMETLVVVLEG